MRSAIWKYALDNGLAVHRILAPKGAEPLSVQAQYREPQLWMLVDIDQPTGYYRLTVVGTGHTLDPAEIGKYVGTWIDGPYFWHAFHKEEDQ